MISSLSVRKDYSTEFTRCINQIIILLPLNKPCKVNLNGIILSVDNGLIINNSDLYQMIKLDDVVELKIPLPIFLNKSNFYPIVILILHKFVILINSELWYYKFYIMKPI